MVAEIKIGPQDRNARGSHSQDAQIVQINCLVFTLVMISRFENPVIFLLFVAMVLEEFEASTRYMLFKSYTYIFIGTFLSCPFRRAEILILFGSIPVFTWDDGTRTLDRL